MKSKTNGNETVSELPKHLVVGAGLGIYLGLAYRHPSEPNASLLLIVVLSLIVTFAVALFQLFSKGRGAYREILRELPLTFAKFFLVMLLLAARFYVWEIGGRILTTIYTTVMGIVAGALIYWKGSGKSSLI